MKWSLTGPFFREPDDVWLHRFVDDLNLEFEVIPRVGEEENWHRRTSSESTLSEWVGYQRTMNHAYATRPDGIVTVFPQLAFLAAARKRLTRSDVRLVAWFFNTEFGAPWKTKVSAAALSSVDAFGVHTTKECDVYSEMLGLPRDRFHFTHLHYGGPRSIVEENEEAPFVFSTGSGFRDYGTFFAAMAKLGYPAKVLGGPRVLAGLTPPRNVEILEQIPKLEIHHHVRGARVNVLPLNNEGICAGGVTIVETFQHGRTLVATERSGGEDYLFDGDNCLTTPLFDVDAMAERIEAVWTDRALRDDLNANALSFARSYCTDEAAARTLAKLLNQVA